MVQFEVGSAVSEWVYGIKVDEETARLSVIAKVETFLRSQLNYFLFGLKP